MLSQLVNGQHTVADQVGLRSGELREHETRAIAEDDVVREMDGLEMFRFSRSRRNRDFLLTDERVDRTRFSDIGIADKTND